MATQVFTELSLFQYVVMTFNPKTVIEYNDKWMKIFRNFEINYSLPEQQLFDNFTTTFKWTLHNLNELCEIIIFENIEDQNIG